ncbi:MAG: hypothetical protein AVDCRST_MAG18-147 [uncultured Thermomicrobiales bacterium]|uniref:Uncharacterized protein n=1 Tax=uncultured Thermomicrobiales bacterium TaxID=1645740 RepID=A0A6J4UIP3_9BACT|nr:MAG: hypothetical protein AVDCRST_MAG18-147 [uncultured Thermomicrobiales bacterium]
MERGARGGLDRCDDGPDALTWRRSTRTKRPPAERRWTPLSASLAARDQADVPAAAGAIAARRELLAQPAVTGGATRYHRWPGT